MIFPIKQLAEMGFEILATAGTAEVLRRNGVTASLVRKHYESAGADGARTAVGRIHDGEVALVVKTPHGPTSVGSPRLAGHELRPPNRKRASEGTRLSVRVNIGGRRPI